MEPGQFFAKVKNLTSLTLSPANSAAVHAIVYEESHVKLTNRFGRTAVSTPIASLVPNATGTFNLETADLSGVDWSKVRYLILVHYLPSGSSAYDMLQAALAQPMFFTQPDEKVEVVLHEALAKFRNNDELPFTLAVVYEKTGRFDDMVVSLRKAIDINPKNAEALNYLGYSFADKSSNLDEALSLIKRAVDLKPDNGYYIDSLGWVYFRQGRFGQALEAIKRSVSIAEDDPELFEHLGDVYHAMGRNELADEAWKRSLQLHEKEEGLKERVEKKLIGLEEEKGK